MISNSRCLILDAFIAAGDGGVLQVHLEVDLLCVFSSLNALFTDIMATTMKHRTLYRINVHEECHFERNIKCEKQSMLLV